MLRIKGNLQVICLGDHGSQLFDAVIDVEPSSSFDCKAEETAMSAKGYRAVPYTARYKLQWMSQWNQSLLLTLRPGSLHKLNM